MFEHVFHFQCRRCCWCLVQRFATLRQVLPPMPSRNCHLWSSNRDSSVQSHGDGKGGRCSSKKHPSAGAVVTAGGPGTCISQLQQKKNHSSVMERDNRDGWATMHHRPWLFTPEAQESPRKPKIWSSHGFPHAHEGRWTDVPLRSLGVGHGKAFLG